ncbi:ferredoxin--NADP reductase [Aliiglaciecola lipolytica]|uniref:Probable phenylacetic acid degradation NADH oxidoreductase paaE n=1 Tax=Aliiglaciecola lipolytica E3 TaxID=1127673 RepID=K6Y8I0_9ALTE|nr:ferredoxin--NADP reductase [Aliiglaciecola lipolytica]GAC14512.1 probable phenylacetic acid degradation NADH oxidoreductase paaE [Aliiglaciecola lipolytica E3]
MTRYHRLTVSEVVQETPDAQSILFKIPPNLKEKFAYKSGQFITIKFPYEGAQLQRCYSMSSTQGLDDFLRVTVKRVLDGRGSNWICDNLNAGSEIDVLQPAGLFVTKDLNEDHLLCAGGSGITPVLSILRLVLSKGSGNVRLIYANRDESSVIFRNTIKDLCAAYPERLEVIHLLDSLQGIPSSRLLASIANGMQKCRAFICGPGPFMDAMETSLKQIGIPDTNIHIERFVIAKPKNNEHAVPLNDTETKEHISESSVSPASTVNLEIDGVNHVIACESGQTVLDAAEAVGIELPYSCREGMCASCMCEVIEGDVMLKSNDVLDERDLANKLTLSCQAVPLTQTLKLKYA